MKLLKNGNTARYLKRNLGIGRYSWWVVDERNQINKLVLENEDGEKYIIDSADGKMPSLKQMKVLNYVLHKYVTEYDMDFNKPVKITTYDIGVNGLGYSPGALNKEEYKNIFNIMSLWKGIRIKYYGKIFDGEEDKPYVYGIIDWASLDLETKELTIKINEPFTIQLKNSKNYYLMNIDEFGKFKSSPAAKMYEFLTEKFKDNNIYEEDIKVLAQLLTYCVKKPSQLIETMKESVDEIKRVSNLLVGIDYNSNEKKVKLEKIGYKVDSLSLLYNPDVAELHKLLPPAIKYHKDGLKLLAEYYEKEKRNPDGPFLFIKSNITYCNERIKTESGAWNYFKKCLEADWGASCRALWLKDENKIKQERIEKNKREEEGANGKEIRIKTSEIFENLEDVEKAKVKEEAEKRLTDQGKDKNNEVDGHLWEFLVDIQVQQIIQEKYLVH